MAKIRISTEKNGKIVSTNILNRHLAFTIANWNLVLQFTIIIAALLIGRLKYIRLNRKNKEIFL
jgi:hypothetical protein